MATVSSAPPELAWADDTAKRSKGPSPDGVSVRISLQLPILQVDGSGRCSVGFAGCWWNAVPFPTVQTDRTHLVLAFLPSLLHSLHSLTLASQDHLPLNYLHQSLESYSDFGGTQTETAVLVLVGKRRSPFQGAPSEMDSWPCVKKPATANGSGPIDRVLL